MSAFPEYRFRCDRCGAEVYVAMEAREVPGPHAWLQLRVGIDPGVPPRHLCVQCVEDFTSFLKAKGLPYP